MSQSKMFGYARVSSKDQNEARQRKELLDFGVSERDIFVDKQSGKNFERLRYQAMRNRMLRKGDVLVIKSIDRFGRNYAERNDALLLLCLHRSQHHASASPLSAKYETS